MSTTRALLYTALILVIGIAMFGCGGTDEPDRAKEGIHPEQCAPDQANCK